MAYLLLYPYNKEVGANEIINKKFLRLWRIPFCNLNLRRKGGVLRDGRKTLGMAKTL